MLNAVVCYFFSYPEEHPVLFSRSRYVELFHFDRGSGRDSTCSSRFRPNIGFGKWSSWSSRLMDKASLLRVELSLEPNVNGGSTSLKTNYYPFGRRVYAPSDIYIYI